MAYDPPCECLPSTSSLRRKLACCNPDTIRFRCGLGEPQRALAVSGRASLLLDQCGGGTATRSSGCALLLERLSPIKAVLKHFDKVDNVGRRRRRRRFACDLFVLCFLLDDFHQRRSILVLIFFRRPSN